MTNYEQLAEQHLAEMVRSANTIATYRRALRHFTDWCEVPLAQLGAGDRTLLVRFVQHLLTQLSPASVRVYASVVRSWFDWMRLHDQLPAPFPTAKALHALDEALRWPQFGSGRRPPEPPEGIERLIRYYDTVTMPPKLAANPRPDRVQRWALETLRNRALMRCLAETGGRISEVLSLRVGDFPDRPTGGVWRVEVIGKGGHRYDLRFLEALPHVRAYIRRRGDVSEAATLFISHSARYSGRALSRQAAAKIIDAARRELGLGKISPHDFRHWRATQLVNAGQPLDVVQDYLGHKSVETTRSYYAHTKAARVDEAAARVGL